MTMVVVVEVNKTTYVSEKSLKMMMMVVVVVVGGLACHVPISVHCYFFG